MKTFIIAAALAVASIGAFAQTRPTTYQNSDSAVEYGSSRSSDSSRETYVAPHYRKDGTYVDGHMRTKPNHTEEDNWSTKGNYNPYTGKPGSKDPSRY